MMKRWLLAPTAVALFACSPPADEYRAALPDRDTVEVHVPESAQTARGLSSSRAALVGEPAEFYTSTYYHAKELNGLATSIIDLVEAITDYPATTVDETSAVWGPFSEEREPNEFKLTVEKDADVATRFEWAIEGRPKSAEAFTALAHGAFEPDGDDRGRGWFVLDFDAIAALDPTEHDRGRVAYAFERTDENTSVRVHFVGRDETGASFEAGYAFGQSKDGDGFVLFAFPEDVHEGALKEDVVIRTRWQPGGEGRADIRATGGDLNAQTLLGSQCWDATFRSTHEAYSIEREIVVLVGDPASCAFEAAEAPAMGELPTAEDVEDPGVELD